MVGAGDLVFEQLGQGCFVIEVFVHCALGVHCGHIVGKAAFDDGFTIDDSDNAVHGDAGADFGPVEGAHEGLGQSEAGGFDDDVVGSVFASEQLFP